jgi:hypothetical protein
MKHLSEEQLILHYYGDALDGEALANHLEVCEPCRASFQSLHRVLESVDGAFVAEAESFSGAEAWRLLAPRLQKKELSGWEQFVAGVRAFRMPRWVLLPGFALLLLAAFLAGRWWPQPGAGKTIAMSSQPISEEAHERILFREIGDHLERSQLALIELINSKTNGVVDISEEQALARQLVEVNRLYRQTATRLGENSIAAVLDDLERTLIEIAHAPAELSELEIAELKQRFEEEDLLFKVKALGNLVRAREMETARNQSGG